MTELKLMLKNFNYCLSCGKEVSVVDDYCNKCRGCLLDGIIAIEKKEKVREDYGRKERLG
ncbi:MAG: hypothetical protein ABH971_02925 [bacterium]